MRKTPILILLLSIFLLQSCGNNKRQHLSEFFKEKIDDIDSVALIQEQYKQESAKQDSLNKIYREEENTKYETSPFITPEEIAAIRPVIAKWLDFYKINLSQFKLVSQNLVDLYEAPDPASVHNREFTDDDDSSDQIEVDYSPDKRFYISLGIMWEQGDDGEYYTFWDDCQEIYFTDRKLKHNKLLLWFGTSMFAEAAFWKDNNTFMLVGYSESYLETLFIYVYNIEEQTQRAYNLLIEENGIYHPGENSGYMNKVNIKERGIIEEK